MKVVITEASTGKLIVEYPVVRENVDDTIVSERDYYDQAWQSAVEDRLVDESAREKYIFTLSQTLVRH